MSDAPEKIWAHPDQDDKPASPYWDSGQWDVERGSDSETWREYILKEASDREKQAAVAAAYEKAAEVLDQRHYAYMAGKGRDPKDYTSGYSIARDAIRALATDDERDALAEVLAEKDAEIERLLNDYQEASDLGDSLAAENERLRWAMDDLLMSPMGIVPKSCDEWYDDDTGTFARAALNDD